MKKRICGWILRTFGWKITQLPPEDVKKYILVVMPHTSNWDFPVGLLVRCSLGKDFKYIAKSSLFKPPFGALFRALGGYPVDRSKSTRFVDAVAEIFNSKEEFVITITPEGTRKKVDHLKTGFYYLALQAKVPLVLTRMDWGRHEVAFSDPFYVSGDLEADLQKILPFFQRATGKHPEQGYV